MLNLRKDLSSVCLQGLVLLFPAFFAISDAFARPLPPSTTTELQIGTGAADACPAPDSLVTFSQPADQTGPRMAIVGGQRGVCCVCRYQSGDIATSNFRSLCSAMMATSTCKNAVWTATDTWAESDPYTLLGKPMPTPPPGVSCSPTLLEVHGHMNQQDANWCPRAAYQLCVSGGGSVCANFAGCLPLQDYNNAATVLQNLISSNPLGADVSITITGSQSTTIGTGAGTQTTVTITAQCSDPDSVTTTLPLCSKVSGSCAENNEQVDCTNSAGGTEHRICCGTISALGFVIWPGRWTTPVNGACPVANVGIGQYPIPLMLRGGLAIE